MDIRTMPVESNTHQFEELTHAVDELRVKALQMVPMYHDVKRIVVYLCGEKGQVGRVKASRLMQLSDPCTLVIGPYYRGSNGSEERDEFCNADLHNVTVLIRLLKNKHPQAFVHMIGFSGGGIQGLLSFQDDPVDSHIIWSGVSDIHLMYEERVDLREMLGRMIGHPKEDKEAYEQRSAIRTLNQNSSPILIVHGGKDWQVGIHQAYFLQEQLELKGVKHDTFYQLGEGHVPRPKALKKVLDYIHQWMNNIKQDLQRRLQRSSL